MDYQDFLRSKVMAAPPAGFTVDETALDGALYDWQRDIVRWALGRGKAAIFADCGLGKTAMQVTWAALVARHTGQPVLILAPLAVAEQTAREGEKFGIGVTVCRRQADVRAGVNVANYEMLPHFEAAAFGGVVLDESSILKSFDGATKQIILDTFAQTPYKLACTATPAPNDHMELGNHAEFLNVMTRAEMLACFFTHDGGDTSKWRLKGHAEDDFWLWVSSWGCLLRKPSDLGYSDDGFDLPPLTFHQHTVDGVAPAGRLFAAEVQTLTERREARRGSLDARIEAAAALVNASDEPWVIWCDLNEESTRLTQAIDGAVEVTGSQPNDEKAARLLAFATGGHRVIVTKPSIAGFGMNWQHCRNMAFVGVSDSWEQFYQAYRRCWRFGQTQEVHVHLVVSDAEGAVVSNLRRKEADAEAMYSGMVAHTAGYVRAHLHQAAERQRDVYQRDTADGQGWTMHLGDCVEITRALPTGSIDYSIFSPPFASLYTYSNSERDMGNSRTDEEFFDHLYFLALELYRVLRPGRLLSFHCMNLPLSKGRDGVIGQRDFRGDLIRLFQRAQFVLHSEVCIWKDPVTAMQRTKAIGLLYKQLKKDSVLSRQGIPDYLITLRKPDDNLIPVTKNPETFPVSLWQQYASPVWMDINASDTLQRESAREEKDERHICPLQLEVIRRAVTLWTNPGETVYSPFGGIGSEGHASLLLGRQFVGAELKHSYWKQACANLQAAASLARMPSLFDEE